MLTRLAFLIAASFALASGARDLDNYTFEQFLAENNLSYHPSELAARRNIFNAELARVKAHNAQKLGWEEDMNRFSAMTPKEKKAINGGRNKGAAHSMNKLKSDKSHSLPADFQLKPVVDLPKNVDWRTKGVVTAVKDQGHCGSCWAFASTAVIESHVALSTGLLFDLSPQQIAMCAPNPNHCGGTGGCQGATSEIAFDYVSGSNGLFQEFQYPYLSYYGQDAACNIPSGTSPKATINGYVELPVNNYTALMNSIAQVGPIAVSVDASTWSAYKGGIFNGCNQKNPDINHAVVLMGYGEENGQKYWLIRNSWSASWGEKGYIRIARSDNEDSKCGTDVTPHDGNACDGQDDPQTVCGTCGVLFDSSYPLNAGTF